MRFILISLMLCGCAERTLAPNPALQNETVNYTKDSDLKVIKESGASLLSKSKQTESSVSNKRSTELPSLKKHNELEETKPLKYSTHKEWVEKMKKSNQPTNQPVPHEFTFENTK